MVLMEANVPIELGIWKGWPNTYWLKVPELTASLEAELKMIRGLQWLLK